MRYYAPDPDAAPSPHELSAYADGELDGLARRRVELWLAAHPEAAAEVAAQRRLTRLLKAAPPPEPAEAAWDTVQNRVETAWRAPRQAVSFRWRPLPWLAVALGTVAAALLLWVFAGTPKVPRDEPAPVAVVEEPYQVASADEVQILSVDAADLPALVVGQSPWHGPLVLAEAGEVELNRAEAGESGWVPSMNEDLVEENAPAIIIAPMHPARTVKP